MASVELNSYRLSSHDEPSDEQLKSIMDEVGEEARESSARVRLELDRRMQQLMEEIRNERELRQSSSVEL